MISIASVTATPLVQNYAQGAAQNALAGLDIANFIAPRVDVASILGKYKVYDQKNRFRLPNTNRAIDGRATRVGFSATDAVFQLDSHALDGPIDDLTQLESEAAGANAVNEITDMVVDIAALSHEKAVLDMALSSVGAGAASVWSAGVDPVALIDEAILSVMKSAKMGGSMGVRVLFGATAWVKFKNHVKVTGKFISNPKGGTNPQVDESMASSMLLAKPEVKTTYSVYDTAPEGLAESIDWLLGDIVLVFAAKPNPTRMDPSFMKTFALRGQFMKPGAYREVDDRGAVVKYDWLVKPVATNTAAAVRLNVSLS